MSLVWTKTRETEVTAKSTACGIFNICRRSGLWWVTIAAPSSLLKLPPFRKLDKAKEACEQYEQERRVQ